MNLDPATTAQTTGLQAARSATEYLTAEWQRRAQGRPQYSMRAFAGFLGIHAAELSQILAGKRVLSERSAVKIAKKLGLTGVELERLLALCTHDRLRHRGLTTPTTDVPHQALTLDAFQIVSEWHCLALLNLLKLKNCPGRPDGMAKSLGIPSADVMQALERLTRIQLVSKKGLRYIPTPDAVFSPQGVPSEAIRKYHRSLLQKAAESLDAQPVDEREHLSFGIAIDPRHWGALKTELRKLLEDFAQRAAARSSSPQELYQLQSAFFRITQTTHTKDSAV